MAIYEKCERIPYTISIQLLPHSIQQLQQLGGDLLDVGKHISLKYLGYEDELNEKKLTIVLNKLAGWKAERKKLIIQKSIQIPGWTQNENILYLRVGPIDYLKEMHYEIIKLLKDEIDIFLLQDFEKFCPHISCRKNYVSESALELDDVLSKITNFEINEWNICLHTSKQEYFLC